MNSSVIKIELQVVDNGTAKIKKFGDEVDKAGEVGKRGLNKISTSAKETDLGILSLVKSAVMFAAVYGTLGAVVGGVRREFVAGLSSIEDFNMSVAQSAALITTFSQKGASGDIAGAFADADNYAKALASEMEIIDTHTIANADHLRAMNQSFIPSANGVRFPSASINDLFMSLARLIRSSKIGLNAPRRIRL